MPSTEHPSSTREGCVCSGWSDHQVIPLGFDTAHILKTHFLLDRERNPWLRLVRCAACGQEWYVAIDTIDDDQYFLRLSAAQLAAIKERNEWPTDYDDFVNVWPDRGPDHLARISWPWKELS